MGHVGRQEVHSADVEADRLHRTDRHVDVVRMNLVCHVGRRPASGEIAR
jgi:hypothetical protein